MAFNLASKFPLSQTIDYFELNLVQGICHFYFYTTKDQCFLLYYYCIIRNYNRNDFYYSETR